MFEGLNELKEAKKEYDALMKSKGENVIRSAVKEFFAAHPEVKALRWRQYTPYFNDGDACTFGFYGSEVKLAADKPEVPPVYACPTHQSTMTTEPAKCGRPGCGKLTEKLDPIEDEDSDWDDSYSGTLNSALKTALKTFDSSMGELEDALLAAFGDHAQITATSKGITIDSYEHD